MVFSSAIFLFAFLPAVFIIYRLLPGIRSRNVFLALSSLVFYAFGQLVYLPLFLASILINYISGLLLSGKFRRSRLILTLAVVLNLGILCVFKYTDFLIGNINSLFGTAIPLTGIVLPIGISFFTFQGLSYTIDVYREPECGTRDFTKLLLYISFFPQLIAGPIVKYHDVAAQIDSRRCTRDETEAGIRRFIVGLAKKVLISNAAGYVVDKVFSDCLYAAGGLDWRLAWLAGICYTLQIYFDFSGYSDMAIGLGHMFGFTFKENFNFPYASTSMTEFWRRWHISLSTWFKEYLYIPLGGNRRGRWRTALNRLIVFFCTGIWHGANWTFVVWGLCHGALTSLENLGVIPVKRLQESRVGQIICRVYTLLSVMLLFVVFRAASLEEAARVIGAMFSGLQTAEGSYMLHYLLTPLFCVTLVAAILFSGSLIPHLRAKIGEPVSAVRVISAELLCLLLFALSVFSLARGGFNPFIYFQF